MNDFQNAKIQKVKATLKQERIGEALKELEEIMREGNLSDYNRITCQILKSRILNKKGEHQNALNLAERTLKNNLTLKRQNLKVDAFVQITTAMFYLGRIDESLELIEKAEAVLNIQLEIEDEVLTRKAYFKNLKGSIFWRKGQLDLALEYLQEALSIQRHLGERKYIASVSYNIGLIYQSKGDLNRALEHFEKSYKVYSEVGDELSAANTFSSIGSIYYTKGIYGKSLEIFKQCLEMFEEINYKRGIALTYTSLGLIFLKEGKLDLALEYCLKAQEIHEAARNEYNKAQNYNVLGIVYIQKGEMEKALDCFQRKLKIFGKLENQLEIAKSFNNIGIVYSYKGEQRKALEYCTKSLRIYRDLGNKQEVASLLNNNGVLLKETGDISEALSLFNESLELRREIGNTFDISNTLFQLIHLFVINSEAAKAKLYIEELREIDDKERNKVINQELQLAEALILRSDNRKEKYEISCSLLKKIANEPVINHKITILAKINLCEYLFESFILSGNEDVLEELKTELFSIKTLGEEKQLHSVRVGALLLIGRLELIESNLDSSEESLKEAMEIAQQLGNLKIAKQCKLELKELQTLKVFSESESEWLKVEEKINDFKKQPIDEVLAYFSEVKAQLNIY